MGGTREGAVAAGRWHGGDRASAPAYCDGEVGDHGLIRAAGPVPQGELHIGNSTILWRRSSATASGWPVRSSACAAGSQPGRSASSATSCVHGGSSVGLQHPQRPRPLRPGRPAGVLPDRRVYGSSAVRSSSGPMLGRESGYAHAGPGRRALQLLAGAVVGTAVFYFVLKALGSWARYPTPGSSPGRSWPPTGWPGGGSSSLLVWIAVDLSAYRCCDAQLTHLRDVKRLRRILRDRVRVLAADRTARARFGQADGIADPVVETVG